MPAVAVQILRYVDPDQPGWVVAELMDAEGQRHQFLDKVPLFTEAILDAESAYPQPGEMACTVLDRWRDERGRQVARISTEQPFGLEADTGMSAFLVLASQLTG